jgi:hypothetical protein
MQSVLMGLCSITSPWHTNVHITCMNPRPLCDYRHALLVHNIASTRGYLF